MTNRASVEGDRGRARRGLRSGPSLARARLRPLLFISLFCLLPAAIVGCPSEVPAEAVAASVVAYGEYEIRSGLPTLARPGSQIRCDAGTIFGVDYRIDVEGGGPGAIPVDFVWVHPELAIPEKRLWGTATPARPPNPQIGWKESTHEGRVLWSLEHPAELVAGRYRFEIRIREDAKVILAQSFDVEGC